MCIIVKTLHVSFFFYLCWISIACEISSRKPMKYRINRLHFNLKLNKTGWWYLPCNHSLQTESHVQDILLMSKNNTFLGAYFIFFLSTTTCQRERTQPLSHFKGSFKKCRFRKRKMITIQKKKKKEKLIVCFIVVSENELSSLFLVRTKSYHFGCGHALPTLTSNSDITCVWFPAKSKFKCLQLHQLIQSLILNSLSSVFYFCS